MRVLALRAGQPGVLAALEPLSVDGMILVATLALGDGRKHRGTAWLAFLVGVTASLSANVIVADHNWTSRAVSAWPAVALLLTVEVLARSGRHGTEAPAEVQSASVPVASVETLPVVPTVPVAVPTEVKPAKPAGTLTDQMRHLFESAVSAGRVPDHKELADATGADRSHARRVHRRLIANLAGPTPSDLASAANRLPVNAVHASAEVDHDGRFYTSWEAA
jgi:hypothetical protein